MSNLDKVLQRVKKMVTLGNNEGATEGERETALRMAYNILAKHNLSMSDLPADSTGEVRLDQRLTMSADKWARNICASVAELFFCKYFFCRTGVSGKDIHVFVGLESNSTTAIGMSEFLIKSIKKEAGKKYSSATSPQGRSFCVGTMTVIHHRVKDILKVKEDDVTEVAPGTSVALYNLHESELSANLKFIEEMGTSLTKAKPRADNSLRYGAYRDGKEFGKTVSLNRQVGSSQTAHKALQ